MEPTAIVFPAIAMFFITFGMVARMAVLRVGAVRRGEISIRYYRLYDEGAEQGRLRQISRHVQNHFEVPPLFYFGLLFSFVTGSVGALSVAFAWLFVAARCVHSWIHLGSNDVSRRFFTFALSLVFLAGLWATLLVSLLRSSG